MLNSELRIKSGLTYGATSRFEQHKARGPFLITTYTRTATTEKAMDLSNQNMACAIFVSLSIPASPTSALGGVKSFIYNELVFYSVTMWTSPPSFAGALSPPREF
jgi:hypothetical protein